MKYLHLLLFCCLIIPFYLQAQKPNKDSTAKAALKELKLTAQQKIAIKTLIWEYKMEERKKRGELKYKLFMLLNERQQAAIRKKANRNLAH